MYEYMSYKKVSIVKLPDNDKTHKKIIKHLLCRKEKKNYLLIFFSFS